MKRDDAGEPAGAGLVRLSGITGWSRGVRRERMTFSPRQYPG